MRNQSKENNNRFIDGRTYLPHFCIDCGKKISKGNFFEGKRRCQKCKSKGKNNPNYKDGRTNNKKCKDCGAHITKTSVRCTKCAGKVTAKRQMGRKNAMFGRIPTHGKRFKYHGFLMRSTWEVKYAKYLDKNEVKWEYEPKAFDLGNTTYTPDFYLPETDTYIEIKGWWRDDAKKKFNKFRKKFCSMNIVLLTYKELKKLGVLK